MSSSRVELTDLAFLHLDDLRARVVRLMPLWENARWRLWLPFPDGGLIEAGMSEMASGYYLAKEPAAQTDLHIPFVEFMWQRASWRNVLRPIASIGDDVSNLATSLAKIDAFWDHRTSLGDSLQLGEFVRTEIEYLLVVARSVLDHLHEIVRFLWDSVQPLDAKDKRKKKELPRKLSSTVLQDGKNLRNPDELMAHYGLTPAIGKFYQWLAPFLRDIRRMRDAVVHHGQSGRTVYVLDNGFAVGRDDRLYAAVDHIWKDPHRYNENVVSLRPLLAHVVLNVVYACNAAANACADNVNWPPELAPGYHVFVRAQHGAALIRAQNVFRGGSPWWDEPSKP